MCCYILIMPVDDIVLQDQILGSIFSLCRFIRAADHIYQHVLFCLWGDRDRH